MSILYAIRLKVKYEKKYKQRNGNDFDFRTKNYIRRIFTVAANTMFSKNETKAALVITKAI